MKRDDVLKTLSANLDEIKGFAVNHIAVFGSVARDEATETSDVDILVEFDENAIVGLFKFVCLKRFLEEILSCRVDLATCEALRSEMKEQILKEAIRAA